MAEAVVDGQPVGAWQHLGFLTLFDRFGDSVHGQHQHLVQPPRYYKDFGFDAAHNGAQMMNILGSGVDPRDHMQQVYAINRNILLAELLGGRLERLLKWLPAAELPLARLVNPIHDLGECTHDSLIPLAGGVVGDIASGQKTAKNKLIEANVLDALLTIHYPDLPPQVRVRAQAIIAHLEDSPAHTLYTWTHDTDRLDTAVNAAQASLHMAQTGGEQTHTFRQLRKLALEVGPRVLAALQPASHLLYVAGKLRTAEPLIATVQRELG
jgi:hypothetical protein